MSTQVYNSLYLGVMVPLLCVQWVVFDNLTGRMDRMEARLNVRMDRLEDRVASHGERLARIEGRLGLAAWDPSELEQPKPEPSSEPTEGG